MTAPAPCLSPTAGLFNGLVRLLNARLTARITELRLLIAIETDTGHTLRTAWDDHRKNTASKEQQ